jgi:hypothetical protein
MKTTRLSAFAVLAVSSCVAASVHAQTTAPATPATTAASQTRPADDPAYIRKVDALRAIWEDVESHPLGSPERRRYLEEFMEKGQMVREFPPGHAALAGLWTLRALASYELNQPREAWLAGEQLLAMGLDRSDNELVRKALALLERRSLVDPTHPLPKKFAQQRRDLLEARQQSNPYEKDRALATVSRIVSESPDYGDAIRLKQYLDAQVPVWQSEARNLLVSGATGNAPDRIREALARGESARAIIGSEPIINVAAASGSLDALKALVAAGATIDSSGSGRPALHAAAASGRANVVAYLLSAGADKHALRDKKNALRLAVESGNRECVKLLLDDPALSGRF